MKIAVMGAAVFAVSLAGSTAVVVLTKGEDPVPADSLSAAINEADSLHGADEGAPSTEQVDSAVDDNEGHAAELPASNMDELAVLVDMTGPLSIGTSEADTAVYANPSARSSVETTNAAVPGPAEIDVVPEVDPGEEARMAAARKTENARQLARIFASMQAQEAAEVLRHLRDDEVVEILGFLGSRKSGQVLSALTSTRAATISRLLLEAEL